MEKTLFYKLVKLEGNFENMSCDLEGMVTYPNDVDFDPQDWEGIWSLILSFNLNHDVVHEIIYGLKFDSNEISNFANNLAYLLAGTIKEFYLSTVENDILEVKISRVTKINSANEEENEEIICFDHTCEIDTVRDRIKLRFHVVQKLIDALRNVLPEIKAIEEEAKQKILMQA